MTTHDNDLYAAIAAQVAQYAHVDVGDDVIDKVLMALTIGLRDAVPGAEFANISLVEDGKVVSIAVTDPVAAQVDDIQAELDTGPCLMAAWEQHHMIIDDYTTDHRWPRFADEVITRTPVRSTISFQLYREPTSMGALNIHAVRPNAFDDRDIAVGGAFATQAAMALHAGTRQGQFEQALASRDLIGQAKGILMQDYSLDANGAFDMLRRLSQDTNIKLVDLARRVVTTARQQDT